MNRKGYFFIVDAFIAIGVIITGLILVSSTYSYVPFKTQTMFLAKDLIGKLASIRVAEMNNPYIDQLRSAGLITDSQITLLQQIGQFYRLDQHYNNTLFVKSITEGMVPPQYGFDFSIEGKVVYNTSTMPVNPGMLISSKKIVYGMLNDNTMWGPYISQVRVWQIEW